jgi:hypothetical protein
MQYCEDYIYTGISKKVVPKQSGKVATSEYKREMLVGIANKLMPNLLASRMRLFRFASGTTLIEIPICLSGSRNVFKV